MNMEHWLVVWTTSNTGKIEANAEMHDHYQHHETRSEAEAQLEELLQDLKVVVAALAAPVWSTDYDTHRLMRVERVDGFGEIIDLAEGEGWTDTHGSAETGDWEPEDADACEQDALDHLTEKGILVIDADEGMVRNIEVLA